MIEKTEFGWTGSSTDLPPEVRDNPEAAAGAAFAATVLADDPKTSVPMPTCEVCQKNQAVDVCCVPGVPYSAAYCKECLEADAHPYVIVVGNTSCCGGLEHTSAEWQAVVRSTLAHLKKSAEDFERDVAEAMRQQGIYFSQQAFLEVMQGELRANKHEGDWNVWKPEPEAIISEIEQHVAKLIANLLAAKNDPAGWAKVREASADVANYCNKAFDVYGQEPEPAPEAA